MDPQKQSAVDAKLKEAYDSVMGVNMPPATQPPPPSPPPAPQEPVVAPLAWHASDPQVTTQTPTPPPQPSFQPQSPLPAPKVVTYGSSDQSIQQNKQVQGKKLSLRWILVAFLIVGFLLGYAIFWIKVFGVKLPILSNFF